MIEAVWRPGSNGAWYVACAEAGLTYQEVLVRQPRGETTVVTIIGELEERHGLHLYDFERPDDFVET